MDFPGNGPPPYQVYCSGIVAKSIQEVQKQALQQGLGKAMIDAFLQAAHRLQTNPNNFGERVYSLPVLRMHVCSAVIRPIAIDFAVCIDRPIVFIKGVKLLSKPSK